MNESKTGLEHAKAVQGSFLHVHGMDNRHMYSNATILMNLRHIVETHSGQLLHASGGVLLVITSNFHYGSAVV